MGESILDAVPHERNFSFAKHTTYGCGGYAETACFPRTEEEACKVLAALDKSGKRYYILGAGSNVLAADGLYRGVVVCTSRVKYIKAGSAPYTVRAGCGVKVAELLAYCKKRGLTGAEFLAGIPATLGGLAFMNGGAGGRFMSDCVSSVRIFDGKIRELANKECNFTYKHSTMRDIKCMILSVLLTLECSTPAVVAKKISERLKARSALPRGKSCGCVFENYCGIGAGRIIENAGLKGVRAGKAYVSREHADFIINGGDRSADVFSLIKLVKSEVYKKFGITLKEEVCYIGDLDDSDG